MLNDILSLNMPLYGNFSAALALRLFVWFWPHTIYDNIYIEQLIGTPVEHYIISVPVLLSFDGQNLWWFILLFWNKEIKNDYVSSSWFPNWSDCFITLLTKNCEQFLLCFMCTDQLTQGFFSMFFSNFLYKVFISVLF